MEPSFEELTLFPTGPSGPAVSRPGSDAGAGADAAGRVATADAASSSAPAEAHPADGPTQRIRLVVAYHGAGFHGFAPQPRGIRTVAGELAAALEKVARQAPGVQLTCAGRTDAGVHAWGQAVHVDLAVARRSRQQGLDLVRLQRALNKLLAPEIVVRQVEVAPEGFDARHSARWRRYRYTVLNRPLPDPFLAATAWHVPEPLRVGLMRLACDPLLGEHDFTSFCRVPKVGKAEPAPSLVRRLLAADWVDEGAGRLVFEVQATAFCHQQVRSLVGFLVDVGLGKRRPGEVLAVLAARDRGAAGTVAPPQGLCLWEVGYPDESVPPVAAGRTDAREAAEAITSS